MSSVIIPEDQRAAYFTAETARRNGQPMGNLSPIIQDAMDTNGYYGPNNEMSLYQYSPSFTPGMMNTQGLERYRSEALRTGPSAWDRLAKYSAAAKQANEQENAMKQAQGQTAASLDELAARGGLSSGARERTIQGGQKNYLSMVQDLNRQGNLNDLSLDVNDEQNRVAQLGQLPGLEKQAIDPMIAENNRRNDYNKWKADSINTAKANERTAQATQNSGKK